MRNKLIAFVQKQLWYPMTSKSIALLRISVAFMYFIEELLIFSHLEKIFGRQGFLDGDLMMILNAKSISLWISSLNISTVHFYYFIYALHLIFCLSFLVGYKTRLFNVLLWITTTIWMNSGHASVYGIHRYFHLFIFLLMWMPSNEYFSIDKLLYGKKPSIKFNRAIQNLRNTLCIRLLQFVLLATYFNAGWAKWKGVHWNTGDAVWKVLNLPEFYSLDFTWLATYPKLLLFLSLSVVFLETFYFVGYFIPKINLYWIYSIIGLHLGIVVFMNMPIFGISMILFNLSLLWFPLISETVERRSHTLTLKRNTLFPYLNHGKS